MSVRYNGVIEKIKQNKSNSRWSAKITCAEFNYLLHYPMLDGEEKKLRVGTQVSFETRPDKFKDTEMSAFRLQVNNKPQQQSAQTVKYATGSMKSGSLINTYHLPKDTSDLIRTVNPANIDNTSLKIQKYIKNIKDKGKYVFKVDEDANFSPAEDDIHTYIKDSQLDILSSSKYHYCKTGTLGSRMILGLGNASVYEVDITLHHTYSIPYIPGSSIKGCLRSFIIRDLFSNNEKKALENHSFADVFGTQKNAGKISFLDAYPVVWNGMLELDIMNPHYSHYYQEKLAPTDDNNPTPLKLYAVPKGTQFAFRLLFRSLSDKTDIKQIAICDITLVELLNKMLHEIGLGAKTSVGYGWFSNIEG